MKQCPNCGQINEPQAAQCTRCGAALPPAMQPPPQPYPQAPYPQQPPAPGFVPTVPPVQSVPRPALPPPALFPRQAYTWKDICTVLGFVAGVVGYFFASILLLPLGLVTSIIGFRGNRYRGLAVAGVVISAIGILLKVMVILQDATFLPDWFTNGIW